MGVFWFDGREIFGEKEDKLYSDLLEEHARGHWNKDRKFRHNHKEV